MAARTALACETHSPRMALLGWAAPLLVLGAFAVLGIVKHTGGLALEKVAAATTESSTLAGAGNAILSHANFH